MKKYRYNGDYTKIYYNLKELAKLLNLRYYEILALLHVVGIRKKIYYVKINDFDKLRSIIEEIKKELKDKLISFFD